MTHRLPPARNRRAMLLALLAAGLASTACAADEGDVVSLDDARSAHEAGRALLFDIRERAEHATGVAAGARLLPMSQLGARRAEIPDDPAQPVLLICNTQNRSSAALKALRKHGFANVRYVHGGMSGWARRGWPMVKPAG
ncbi:MAG: rhodanese-like domain-containing protein [Hydrogenophaga sp.]|nr:rhodanese-like domain-containing protein [Hydrogenophaga sp.]